MDCYGWGWKVTCAAHNSLWRRDNKKCDAALAQQELEDTLADYTRWLEKNVFEFTDTIFITTDVEGTVVEYLKTRNK